MDYAVFFFYLRKKYQTWWLQIYGWKQSQCWEKPGPRDLVKYHLALYIEFSELVVLFFYKYIYILLLHI